MLEFRTPINVRNKIPRLALSTGLLFAFWLVLSGKFDLFHMAMGLAVSFGGVCTYPKSRAMRRLLEKLPEDRFLLETDSPWLPPQSRRGKRNEPALVREVAEKIASVRRTDLGTIAAATTRTAERIFNFED